MKVVKSAAAKRDLFGHFVYIGSDSPAAAERLIDQAEATFNWLAIMPRVGRLWGGRNRRTRTLRVWPIAGFPDYLIFYRVRPTAIEIARVLHGSRDLERQLRKG